MKFRSILSSLALCTICFCFTGCSSESHEGHDAAAGEAAEAAAEAGKAAGEAAEKAADDHAGHDHGAGDHDH